MTAKLVTLTIALGMSGIAMAQGIFNTSKSFSTSEFCKAYACTWVNEGGTHTAQWIYKNKFGDLISIIRESSNPSSKIVKAIFVVPNADADQYFDEDKKTFNSFQKTILGSVKTELQPSCYYSNPTILSKFTYSGKSVTINCFGSDGVMTIGIVFAQK